MEISAVKKAIVTLIEAKKGEIAAIAEDVHGFRETGLQEHKTAALLTDILANEGFTVKRGMAGLATAFAASHGETGPCIAILAEMDALPGIGHACGHNIIAAATVGAAIGLRYGLPPGLARITVLGTPAEEMGIGKIELIKAGCFSNVDFAMMVHPSSKRQVLKMYLAVAKVRFTFFGKAAHAAAYPEEGINALDGVIQTFNAMNALRQHVRQDVRIHGIISEGGVVPNVIPERAACYFYVRSDDMGELERVKERLIACARGAAVASGCRLEVAEDERVLAPLRPNRAFSALYSAQLRYLGLQESAAPADKNKGSSDIGNVSQVVPTIHPHVPIGEGIQIHSEAFARAAVSEQGKAAAVEGAIALALTAAELALSPGIQKEIRDEFAAA